MKPSSDGLTRMVWMSISEAIMTRHIVDGGSWRRESDCASNLSQSRNYPVDSNFHNTIVLFLDSHPNFLETCIWQVHHEFLLFPWTILQKLKRFEVNHGLVAQPLLFEMVVEVAGVDSINTPKLYCCRCPSNDCTIVLAACLMSFGASCLAGIAHSVCNCSHFVVIDNKISKACEI